MQCGQVNEMEECGNIYVASDANQQCSEAFFEQSHEHNVDTMNHISEQDGAIVGQDDTGPPVFTEHGSQDTDPLFLKEDATQDNVQQPGTWMEQSVKIRENVVDMLEYVTLQLQHNLPDKSVEQLGERFKQEDEVGGVDIAKLQMTTEPVAFAGSEDEEILPDVGGSGSCLSFVAWTSGNVNVKNEALENVQGEHETEQHGFETEMCKPAVVIEKEEEDTKEHVLLPVGVSGDDIFAGADMPCVSQEEIIANCADADGVRETEVPLPFSGTFNNFKDAEVTVEMNEEEVDVLGAPSPAVKSHDYSDDDSDGSHNNMGYHREPLQQAMFHAMAPLPRNNGGNTTVPFSTQVMSNIAYVRGVKREYPSEMQMQGPVRTKAARKITPPSPVKKEVKRESASSSGNPNKNLQENLRKQELDETFFTCDFCFKLFRRRNALMAHIKLHEALNIGNHNGHIYECKQCKKTYSSRYNLNHHTKRCHGDKDYKCLKCNEAFTTQSDLSKHSRTHGVRSYKCNRCGKVFQKRKTFSAHTKVHPQVIYECITCFQKFSWEEELIEHNKIHQVPDGAPVTALTVKPDLLACNTEGGEEPTVTDGKGQVKHSLAMKLEYCYSYINQVKTEFANELQSYQDFLNTIKQFKFKSIDINQFLEQIAGIFQDHPTLIDGFNIFLPDECKVELPKVPKKKTILVHDPLLDRQYNPRGELDDSLAYLGQVKARFSDKPIIYNTFTYIIKEYKLNSLQIPEVAARVTALFKDHPDLILGFNTFLPSNNKISVPCYDSQHEGSDVQLHLTEPSRKQATHGNRRDAHEDSATKAAADHYSQNKNSLTNGDAITLSNVDNTTATVTVNADKCAKTVAGDIVRKTHANNKVYAKSRNVDTSETKIDTEHRVIETHVARTDCIAEIHVTGEIKASYDESNGQNNDVLENDTLSVTDLDQYEGKGVPDITITKDTISKSSDVCSPENTKVVGTSDNASLQENIALNQDNTCGMQSVITSAWNVTSNHESKIQLQNKRDYELVSNNNEAASCDNEVSSVTGIDTFTNIITVSPSDPSNALPDVERTVALTNPKFPKVSVISAVATGTQHKTTKYGGKGVAFTTVNVKPSAIPKTLDAGKSTERLSPTKIVPLKNSLLYQQLISQSNFRGHSNPSLATFTKIDAPGLNDKKKAFGSEPNSRSGDNSTKINTISSVRNPMFKSGIKISVPYIVNSPNSNVIFTLANTMVDDNSKVHGSADNANLITSTDSSGLEFNQNGKAVYTVSGSNTSTSSANVALISTNTLQNASSTNSYTGLNIVTSTNIAPSTYTLANTKSIASFPAAVPAGNGPNKQMLLIRTNPPSNAFFISNSGNSGNRMLSSDNPLRSTCLVPITKTASSNVNSCHVSEVNASNSNLDDGTQCAVPNKILSLATKTFTTLANNKVGKPNFLTGQKIAIVKTIADKTMWNAKTARALTTSNAIANTVVSKNVVNASGTKRYMTNTIGNTSTSPKKRKLVPNRVAAVANISIKKKTDSPVRSHTYRNRPLLPASSNNSQTPIVVSFLPSAAGDTRGENEPESSMPVCSTPVSSDQSNSQVVRTYERSVGNKPEEAVLEQFGICNNIQNAQIVKTKAARKQCLIVKTVSITDELKPSGLEHNGTLGSEICPKTYSRRDSLTKRVLVETHSMGMDLS